MPQEIEIEAAESIRKRGYNYESFLYQTLYDSLLKFGDSMRSSSPEAYFYAYTQVYRMGFPVLIRSRGDEFRNFVTEKCNSLNQMAQKLPQNFQSRINFFIECQTFMDEIAQQLKKAPGFLPPKSTAVVVGGKKHDSSRGDSSKPEG